MSKLFAQVSQLKIETNRVLPIDAMKSSKDALFFTLCFTFLNFNWLSSISKACSCIFTFAPWQQKTAYYSLISSKTIYNSVCFHNVNFKLYAWIWTDAGHVVNRTEMSPRFSWSKCHESNRFEWQLSNVLWIFAVRKCGYSRSILTQWQICGQRIWSNYEQRWKMHGSKSITLDGICARSRCINDEL